MAIPHYQLELLERHTSYKFAIVKDGVAHRLDGSEIPVAHLAYQKVPKDGQYYMSLANCGRQDCSVGAPKPGCVKKRIYAPKKCAVYFLYSDIGSCDISVYEFMAMLDETLDDIL